MITAKEKRRKWTYYMLAKFTTDTPITREEAERFVKLAIHDLGEGSDVQWLVKNTYE